MEVIKNELVVGLCMSWNVEVGDAINTEYGALIALSCKLPKVRAGPGHVVVFGRSALFGRSGTIPRNNYLLSFEI